MYYMKQGEVYIFCLSQIFKTNEVHLPLKLLYDLVTALLETCFCGYVVITNMTVISVTIFITE